MSNSNLRQILAALADALDSQNSDSLVNDPLPIVNNLPKRSLSGDHIHGGKITKFASAGILDESSSTQLKITDQGVDVINLIVSKINSDLTIRGELSAKKIDADIVKAAVLEVDEIRAEIKYQKETSIIFDGDNIYGKGILWTGIGPTKQLIFNANPDRIMSSEHVDLAPEKHFSIGGIKVIDDKEIGPSVSKSSLREVGRLKGLIVDGSVTINDYLFYNASADRLGIGTDEPKAALTVAEDSIDVMLGTKDSVKGMVGTYASHSFDIVTDNTSRISVSANGNVLLGNNKNPPIQVSVHGKLAIKVNTPDPDVDLHVNGAIKYNGRLQKYDSSEPTSGSYNPGDIVWNNNPKINSFVGWICVQPGSPGVWAPFGKIGN